jgi:glutaredoxin
MTDMAHINGKEKGIIRLYALSTCVWCKKTKKLLDELHVSYDYFYVDLLEGKEKEDIMKEVEKWNPRCSFPTLVINNKDVIVGFKEEEIHKKLGS